MAEITRRPSIPVNVGGVWIGGASSHCRPVDDKYGHGRRRVDGQADGSSCCAGSELVRITVNTREAARGCSSISSVRCATGTSRHRSSGISITTVTFCCANTAIVHALLDKYRINPGNVGMGRQHDDNFRSIIEIANEYAKPVRIGVNWGSLDQSLVTRLMDENARSPAPKDSRAVIMEAMVRSAIDSAEMAESYGMPRDRIILSAKVSGVQDLIDVYRELARRSSYALHLGLTEAGMGRSGIVSSSAALSVLLQEGIGDTIRVSLTPAPGGDRTEEVRTCQDILQSLGIRTFSPRVTACPGCGRTTSTLFQEMADDIQGYLSSQMPVWKADLSRRGEPESRRDGLRRQRPGRIQACQYRNFVARNGRRTESSGLRRWPSDDNAERTDHRARFHRDSR